MSQLRFMYWRSSVDALLAAFPHRTLSSLRQRAHKLGLCFEKHWTTKEDARLTFLWEVPLRITAIAKRMKRTPLAVYARAKKIGLSVGCPDGHEYVSTAAVRTGFHLTTLRRVLAFGEVKEHQSLADPHNNRKYQRQHFVEILDVDDAVAKWNASEPVATAAARRGMTDWTLTRWLVDAGVLSENRTWKKHHRIASEVIDRVIAERASRSELLSEAGRRGGASRQQRYGAPQRDPVTGKWRRAS